VAVPWPDNVPRGLATAYFNSVGALHGEEGDEHGGDSLLADRGEVTPNHGEERKQGCACPPMINSWLHQT
jgi:hypothetical protein